MRRFLILLVLIFALSSFSFQFFVPDLSTAKAEFGLTTKFTDGINPFSGVEFQFFKANIGNDIVLSLGAGPLFVDNFDIKLSFKIGTYNTKGFASIDSYKGFMVGVLQAFWNGYFKSGVYINDYIIFIGFEF